MSHRDPVTPVQPGRRPATGRLLRVAVVVAALGATARCADEPPPNEDVATVLESGGGATVRHGDEVAPASKGTKLVAGDRLSTGADGRVRLGFPGGNEVDLEPGSSAAIEHSQGPGARLGLKLDQGSARAVTVSRGARLVIGTPFGRVDVATASDVEVSAASLVVHVGSIEVTRPDGQKQVVLAGARFVIGGPAAGTEETTPEVILAPLKFILTTASRQVQIRGPTDPDWRASGKREELKPDVRVRTRQADETRLQLDSRAAVVLRSNTEIATRESGKTAGGSAAHLELSSGSATFIAGRDADGAGGHEIEVAGRRLRIEPGPEAANVDVVTDGRGQTQVAVHLGRAALEGGEVVEAGYAVTLAAGQAAVSPVPLARTFIELAPGGSAVVYCGGRVPPVRFTWAAGEAKAPFAVELASDERFTRKVLREEVSKPGFVYDQLKLGSWYWRVRVGGAWQTGTLVIARERGVDCPRCKRVNIVEETGEETTVYYQEKVPAITMRWRAATGAVKYRVRIFAAGALDRPRFAEEVVDTTLALPAGRLTEAAYAWSVQALDSAGNVLASGPVNGLTLTYDNGVAGLLIRTPRSGVTTRETSIPSAGEVALGEKLVVNGAPVPLDGKGRFATKVGLVKGLNQIVYQLPGTGARARYWVRDLTASIGSMPR